MRERFRPVVRSFAVIAAAVVTALIVPSCTVSEGDRCNPSRQPDECAEGTACIVPKGCVIAVCCPLVGTGISANCGPNPPCLVDASQAETDADLPDASETDSAGPEASSPDSSDASPGDATPRDSALPDASDASAD
jgi:hypothetical protein